MTEKNTTDQASAKEVLGSLASVKPGETDSPDNTATAPVPSSSKEDITHIEGLEKRIFGGERESAEACKELVQTRAYRARGYERLEDYAPRWLGHKRAWVYKKIRWLEMVEACERAGVSNWIHLPTYAEEVFRQWAQNPEVFFAAYGRLSAAGGEITKPDLEEACRTQVMFEDWRDRIEDLTWDEWTAWWKLSNLPTSVRTFKNKDELLATCKKAKEQPSLEALCAVARDKELIEVCSQLEGALADARRVKALKAKKEQLKDAQKSTMKNLKTEISNVEKELQELEGQPNKNVIVDPSECLTEILERIDQLTEWAIQQGISVERITEARELIVAIQNDLPEEEEPEEIP
jgi:hypothetical protein